MGRKIYLDGNMVPENEARISVFDIGFMYGATVYESLRTFRHKIFKMDEHLARLERSLRYIGLEPGAIIGEVADAVKKVLSANIHLTDKDDDVWMCAQVTPGKGFPHPVLKQTDYRPTIIVFDTNMPYADYVRYYSEGAGIVTTRVRNISPEVIDCRVKHRSRLHFFLAKREAMAQDPDAYAVLMDGNGNISEATGANFFTVSGNKLYTPPEKNILVGISRQTVIGLAGEMNIPVVEKDMNLYDVYNSDEAFLTTSSYCILPISRVNGVKTGAGKPGAVTNKLLDAWSETVGVDIVEQARRFSGI
ncbi:MAG: aminotransferase class IV [Candidatus Omnitrophica bacterium]|nr:aminotransferase class IV [Candidatus Omnitrophota bacterium]